MHGAKAPERYARHRGPSHPSQLWKGDSDDTTNIPAVSVAVDARTAFPCVARGRRVVGDDHVEYRLTRIGWQEAVVRPGGLVPLAHDVSTLHQFVSDQKSTGVAGNGMDALLRGMFPMEPGTRVRVVGLGWDGLDRTAHVVIETLGGAPAIPTPQPVSSLTAAVLAQHGLGEGWTYAQWLAPVGGVAATTPGQVGSVTPGPKSAPTSTVALDETFAAAPKGWPNDPNSTAWYAGSAYDSGPHCSAVRGYRRSCH